MVMVERRPLKSHDAENASLRFAVSPFRRFSKNAREITAALGVVLSALAIFLLLLATGCKEAPPPEVTPPKAPPPPTAVFPDGFAVKMSLAITPEEQERGLMFVEDLPDDRGMIFIYDADDIRPFWMKNCKISMDFIWLAANGSVVDITRDAPPCPGDPCPTFQSSAPSRYNLEVRGGLAAAHGLKTGDKVSLHNLPSK
jgi:uncharacterized protein